MLSPTKTNLRILFLCDFDLSRESGKDRATKQKLNALGKKVQKLTVISSRFRTPLARVFLILLLDFKAMINVLIERPDWLLSRGHTGLLSQRLAKKLGILTIREVHTDALEEVNLISSSKIHRVFLKALAALSNKIDLDADVRIFNHPDLLWWYKSQGLAGDKDFFSYNGFDPAAKSDWSKEEARRYFGIDLNERIIVFVGAASKWHGVEYLVDLQREFNRFGDSIRIVIGGGEMSEYDPEGLCLNFSPLDQDGCANLIRAADLCALPVKSNRKSPGSPLKLYDYIVNQRFVLAQKDTKGYSDEVQDLGVGFLVDYSNPEEARLKVLDILETDLNNCYPKCNVSWSDRVEAWIKTINGI